MVRLHGVLLRRIPLKQANADTGEVAIDQNRHELKDRQRREAQSDVFIYYTVSKVTYV